MDDSLRLFVEECDTFQVRTLSVWCSGSSWGERCLQGLQLCTDNASFGSFANSLLTAFRDEFPKQPTLTFSVLSDAVSGDLDVDDVSRSSGISSFVLYDKGADARDQKSAE
jgi:hypothetical protein